MSNRLEPLSPPYPAAIAAILDRYPQQDGYILSLFRTFANSERFLSKAVPNLLDKESPLDLRTREIVILRTTANRRCEYEWGVHVAIFARAARLSDSQVRATTERRADCWTGRDALLIDVVDQLCATGSIDEASIFKFHDEWDVAQQLEILALVGTYTTISLVANVAALAPEPFAARFPTSANPEA